MGFETALDRAIRLYVMHRKAVDTRRRERIACERHPEWTGLTEQERRLAGKDMHAYMIFKNLHGGDMRYFIPEAIFQNEVLYRLNYANYGPDGRYRAMYDYFADKNFQTCFLPGIKAPECVLRRIDGIYYTPGFEALTPCEAYKALAGHSELVFKHSTGTGHGKGVLLVSKPGYGAAMLSCENLVIQKKIVQHNCMVRFNKSSVNVVRITTLAWRGHVYVLGGILRVGAPGSFCDHKGYAGRPPLVAGLDENGWLTGHAVDCDGHTCYQDINGVSVEGLVLKYHEMKEAAIVGHRHMPRHGIIGWDFALDENEEVICIEYNERFPGVTQTQYALGPVFGQLSVDGRSLYDEIMEE